MRCVATALMAAGSSSGVDEARALASVNRLIPSDFPDAVIRELMTAADGQTETQRRWAEEMPSDIELCAPPRPLQDAHGRVTSEHMAYLHSLEKAAAAEGRYEDAVYLQRLQKVIDPTRPTLTYEQCAPHDPDDAASFFLENGFVIIKGAMSPERVARVQAGWARFAPAAHEAWEEHRQHSHGIKRHYFDTVEAGWGQVARKWYGVTDAHLQPPGDNVPKQPFLEMDESFVDLIDNHKVAAVARQVLIGTPDNTVAATGDADPWVPNRGTLRCLGASPRTYPPDADGAGYVRHLRPCVLAAAAAAATAVSWLCCMLTTLPPRR
jgi:hypothetical protein